MFHIFVSKSHSTLVQTKNLKAPNSNYCKDKLWPTKPKQQKSSENCYQTYTIGILTRWI